MKTKIFILFILIFSAKFLAQGQGELNCQVKINYSQLQGSTNKQIFDQLEKSILSS